MAFDATLPFSEEAVELPKNEINKKPAPQSGTLLIPWHDFEVRHRAT